MKLSRNGILAVLLAASFAVCTYAQGDWSKPIHISSQKVETYYKHAMPIPDVIEGVSGNAKYRVRASRHDGPKEAEIHLLDTNIFYVTGGEATLVVGGKVVDAHPIEEPFEMRGKSIVGGKPYLLKKGDIMIVPRGTPLQFTKVEKAPFLFFEVKVQ